MTMHTYVAIYLVLNLATFGAFWWDKRQAVRHGRRIPEVTLLTLAAVGGSLGALCGMNVLRHKTKHLAFALGIPMIMGGHLILLSYINL